MAADDALVVYFSATGSTKRVAASIASVLKISALQISPKQPYTDADLEWRSPESRCSRENADRSIRPELASSPYIDNFDTLIIGYPIWFGTVPRAVLTFIEDNDFNDKRLILFCTSHSNTTGGSSALEISAAAKGARSVSDAQVFRKDASTDEIAAWIEGLEL